MTVQDIMKISISPLEIINNKSGLPMYIGIPEDIPLELLDYYVVGIASNKTTNIIVYVER